MSYLECIDSYSNLFSSTSAPKVYNLYVIYNMSLNENLTVITQIKQIVLSAFVPCAMPPAFPSGFETQALL